MANDKRDRVNVRTNADDAGTLVHTRDLDDFDVPKDSPDPRGWDVRSPDGTKIGKVEDLIVDTGEGRVRYVEIALDKDFAKDAARDYALVPIGQARLDDDNDDVIVEMSATELAGAPRYDRKELSREYETSLRTWAQSRRHDERSTVDANARKTTTDRDAGFYSSPEYDDRRFFTRSGRSTGGTGVGDAARRGANKVVDAADNVKDRIDGNPASKPGLDPTDARAGGRNFAERAADTVRGTDDRLADTGTGVGDAARRGTNKVIDAVDNVKDRIDGNPASKPGPDPTDKRL